MALPGARQTFTVTIPLTTPAAVARVTNCIGAVGVLVRLSGGAGAGTLVAGCTAQCADANSIAANNTGFTLNPQANVNTVKMNTVLPDGGYVLFATPQAAGTAPMWYIPTPCIDLFLAATAASTGTVIHAWPIYPDSDVRGTFIASLP